MVSNFLRTIKFVEDRHFGLVMVMCSGGVDWLGGTWLSASTAARGDSVRLQILPSFFISPMSGSI